MIHYNIYSISAVHPIGTCTGSNHKRSNGYGKLAIGSNGSNGSNGSD